MNFKDIDKELLKKVRKHIRATAPQTFGKHLFYWFEPFGDDFRGGYVDIVSLPVYAVIFVNDMRGYTGEGFKRNWAETYWSE